MSAIVLWSGWDDLRSIFGFFFDIVRFVWTYLKIIWNWLKLYKQRSKICHVAGCLDGCTAETARCLRGWSPEVDGCAVEMYKIIQWPSGKVVGNMVFGMLVLDPEPWAHFVFSILVYPILKGSCFTSASCSEAPAKSAGARAGELLKVLKVLDDRINRLRNWVSVVKGFKGVPSFCETSKSHWWNLWPCRGASYSLTAFDSPGSRGTWAIHQWPKWCLILFDILASYMVAVAEMFFFSLCLMQLESHWVTCLNLVPMDSDELGDWQLILASNVFRNWWISKIGSKFGIWWSSRTKTCQLWTSWAEFCHQRDKTPISVSPGRPEAQRLALTQSGDGRDLEWRK